MKIYEYKILPGKATKHESHATAIAAINKN